MIQLMYHRNLGSGCLDRSVKLSKLSLYLFFQALHEIEIITRWRQRMMMALGNSPQETWDRLANTFLIWELNTKLWYENNFLDGREVNGLVLDCLSTRYSCWLLWNQGNFPDLLPLQDTKSILFIMDLRALRMCLIF